MKPSLVLLPLAVLSLAACSGGTSNTAESNLENQADLLKNQASQFGEAVENFGEEAQNSASNAADRLRNEAKDVRNAADAALDELKK